MAAIYREQIARTMARPLSIAQGPCHMGMLYMMTRMGAAKAVTDTFEAVMGRASQTFREFVRKNRAAWRKP